MSIFNIHIFHENLDIPRKVSGLKKSEFSAMLGVKNVFRKDYNSIGPKLLYGIQRHFAGVDEDWLLKDHGNEEINIKLKNELSYEKKRGDISPHDKIFLQDSNRGSYGIPEIRDHKVKEILASLSPEEMLLIEAIREIDPISRIGILSMAINQFNEAKRDPTIKNNDNKIKIIDKAIKALSKTIAET